MSQLVRIYRMICYDSQQIIVASSFRQYFFIFRQSNVECEGFAHIICSIVFKQIRFGIHQICSRSWSRGRGDQWLQMLYKTITIDKLEQSASRRRIRRTWYIICEYIVISDRYYLYCSDFSELTNTFNTGMLESIWKHPEGF